MDKVLIITRHCAHVGGGCESSLADGFDLHTDTAYDHPNDFDWGDFFGENSNELEAQSLHTAMSEWLAKRRHLA